MGINDTGRVDCKCGDQILSNSGKEISVAPIEGEVSKLMKCWNPECGGIYHRDDIYKARKEGDAVVFDDSTDIKVFMVGDGPSDWIAAKSKEDAVAYYNAYYDGDYHIDDYQETSLYSIWFDEDRTTQITVRKVIDQQPEFPCIIGSTEF